MNVEKLRGTHFSFLATNKILIYSIVIVLVIVGLTTAVVFKEPTYFSRVGNFIIGAGVWISMRYTLREGVGTYKDLVRLRPSTGDRRLNSDFFNDITFSIGDARLQIHGFVIVIVGSVVGSFGDLMLLAYLN